MTLLDWLGRKTSIQTNKQINLQYCNDQTFEVKAVLHF